MSARKLTQAKTSGSTQYALGQIDIDMLAAVEQDASDGDPVEARQRVIAAIPASCYGTSEEVAALTAFLCRDDAKFINGSIYTIDGGFTPF